METSLRHPETALTAFPDQWEFHLTVRHRYTLGLLLALTLLGPAATTALRAAPNSNWPALGGPEGTSISPETGLPIEWSATKNIAWKTGAEVWRVARPVSVTWATPTLVTGGERDELVAIGNEWIISYDPVSGEELWRMLGLEANAIHRPLIHGNTIIATAGYPQKSIKAVKLGGSGDLTDTDYLAWAYNKGTAYIPSNLVYDGYVYLLNDQGILTCLDADTGKIVYEGGRMPVAQRFSASPVAFDGKFLMSGNDGDVFVIQAGPEFEVLSVNSMGEGIWASPAIANGRIYIRTLDHLWAIEQMN